MVAAVELGSWAREKGSTGEEAVLLQEVEELTLEVAGEGLPAQMTKVRREEPAPKTGVVEVVALEALRWRQSAEVGMVPTVLCSQRKMKTAFGMSAVLAASFL